MAGTALIVALSAAFALAPTLARAQSGYQLSIVPGTEVRLSTVQQPSRLLQARAVSTPADSLVVRFRSSAAEQRYALSALNSLELLTGENKRKGVLIGGGIAAGITTVFGGIDLSKNEISRDEFVGTLLVNTLIGGLIGYAFAPKGWEALPIRLGR